MIKILSKTKQIWPLIRSHLIKIRMQIYIQNLRLTKNIKQRDADTLILINRVSLVPNVILLMAMKNLENQMTPSNRICSILLSKVKIKILKCHLKIIEAILEGEAEEEIFRTTQKLASTTITHLNKEIFNKMNLEGIFNRKII